MRIETTAPGVRVPKGPCGHCGRVSPHEAWCLTRTSVPLGEWVRDAACAETDPHDFETSEAPPEVKKLCNACPVQLECARYAVGSGQSFGVWAGMSERERSRLGEQLITSLMRRRERRSA